ncbi:MAG: tetratricopeptide repeat protein, partial [Bryobacteraceae bacterium]
ATRTKQRQFSSAFFLYKEALKRAPQMRGLHAGLAEVYRESGHADWAAVEQQREQKLGAPDCAMSKLECDYGAGRYSEVAAAAKTKTAEAYYWRSRAYNELATAAFGKLMQLPPSVESHEFMAEVHRNQRRYKEAVEELRKALEKSGGSPRIEVELARAMHQATDFEAARGLLSKLLKLEPDSAELNFLMGDSLLNLQKAQEAVSYLSKAVQKDGRMLAAHASLARAYMQTGGDAKAIPHLKAALPLDTDGSMHYQLARAYQGSGQAELARETLARYQKISAKDKAEKESLEQDMQITAP